MFSYIFLWFLADFFGQLVALVCFSGFQIISGVPRTFQIQSVSEPNNLAQLWREVSGCTTHS